MIVQSIKIPDELLAEALAEIRQAPFALKDLQQALEARGIDPGVSAEAAKRILQRERKAGSLIYDADTALWHSLVSSSAYPYSQHAPWGVCSAGLHRGQTERPQKNCVPTRSARRQGRPPACAQCPKAGKPRDSIERNTVRTMPLPVLSTKPPFWQRARSFLAMLLSYMACFAAVLALIAFLLVPPDAVPIM